MFKPNVFMSSTNNTPSECMLGMPLTMVRNTYNALDLHLLSTYNGNQASDGTTDQGLQGRCGYACSRCVSSHTLPLAGREVHIRMPKECADYEVP